MAVKEEHRFNKLSPSKFIWQTGDTKPTKSIQYQDQDVLPFSEGYEVDGSGNIVDWWLHDGTRWNH